MVVPDDRVLLDLLNYDTLLRSMRDFLPGASSDTVLFAAHAHLSETLRGLGYETVEECEAKRDQLTAQIARELSKPQASGTP